MRQLDSKEALIKEEAYRIEKEFTKGKALAKQLSK
jgi:hypothetical protein